MAASRVLLSGMAGMSTEPMVRTGASSASKHWSPMRPASAWAKLLVSCSSVTTRQRPWLRTCSITVSSSSGTSVRRSTTVTLPGKRLAAAMAQYTPMP